jgi:hypothetical protein
MKWKSVFHAFHESSFHYIAYIYTCIILYTWNECTVWTGLPPDLPTVFYEISNDIGSKDAVPSLYKQEKKWIKQDEEEIPSASPPFLI